MSERLRFRVLSVLGLIAAVGVIWCIAAWRVGGFEQMADLFGEPAGAMLERLSTAGGVLGILGFLGVAYIAWLATDTLWRTREDLKHRERERNDKP